MASGVGAVMVEHDLGGITIGADAMDGRMRRGSVSGVHIRKSRQLSQTHWFAILGPTSRIAHDVAAFQPRESGGQQRQLFIPRNSVEVFLHRRVPYREYCSGIFDDAGSTYTRPAFWLHHISLSPISHTRTCAIRARKDRSGRE